MIAKENLNQNNPFLILIFLITLAHCDKTHMDSEITYTRSVDLQSIRD